MANSKIIFGGQTLIDLTGDTVTAEQLAKGATAHGKDGELITGTSTKDVDSGDATAAEGEILKGKTAYARGAKLTGTMPNNGAISGKISTKAQKFTISNGYHDGSGVVQIDPAEQGKLIPSNIKEGITVLGVVGTHSGEKPVTAQEKTATPTTEQQIITPDDGFDYLNQVTVNAIPYNESPNSAGGITVTIA